VFWAMRKGVANTSATFAKTRPLTVPLRPRRQQPEPLIPDEKVEDLGDISPIRSFETYSPSYDELFDWMWNNFSSMTATKFEEMRTLTLEVTVDRDQRAPGRGRQE
jgi:hypothetical protein